MAEPEGMCRTTVFVVDYFGVRALKVGFRRWDGLVEAVRRGGYVLCFAVGDPDCDMLPVVDVALKQGRLILFEVKVLRILVSVPLVLDMLHYCFLRFCLINEKKKKEEA